MHHHPKTLVPYINQNGWRSFKAAINRDFIRQVVETTKNAILFDGDSGTRAEHLILTSSALDPSIENSAVDGSNLSISARTDAAEMPSELSHLPFCCGYCGYLSYDFGETQVCPDTPRPDLAYQGTGSDQHNAQPNLPQVFIGYYTWSYVINFVDATAWLNFSPSCSDHLRSEIIELYERSLALKSTSECTASKNSASRTATTWRKNLSHKMYHEQLGKISDYILSGDCYQVNFTQRYQAKLPINQFKGNQDSSFTSQVWEFYESIRRTSNAHYGGFLKLDDERHVLSFSPEQFLRICHRKVITKPIKGTVDSALHDAAERLLASSKDRAENLMIVDLLRNDLGKVCKTGSVKTTKLFDIETYKHLHHMVSTIEGDLREDITEFDALLACFPGGSITGAPKKRAMEIIQELEQHKRSVYCGSMFYLSDHGVMDSNILIRSVAHERGDLFCWSGGGIVADSDSDSEYAESLTKVRHITGLNM